MDVKYEILPENGERIVYVRPVNIDDLPEELRAQVEGGIERLFAVHDADGGERLALVRGRRLAFALARQNDLSPVSVH